MDRKTAWERYELIEATIEAIEAAQHGTGGAWDATCQGRIRYLRGLQAECWEVMCS